MALAYATLLRRKCEDCEKNATKEVFGRFNQRVGFYCREHAWEKVREINFPPKEMESQWN